MNLSYHYAMLTCVYIKLERRIKLYTILHAYTRTQLHKFFFILFFRYYLYWISKFFFFFFYYYFYYSYIYLFFLCIQIYAKYTIQILEEILVNGKKMLVDMNTYIFSENKRKSDDNLENSTAKTKRMETKLRCTDLIDRTWFAVENN